MTKDLPGKVSVLNHPNFPKPPRSFCYPNIAHVREREQALNGDSQGATDRAARGYRVWGEGCETAFRGPTPYMVMAINGEMQIREMPRGRHPLLEAG